ncbi:WD repeat-containing protein 62-like [Protopterus annectens]|uniref:WD repeat-containing protein 62-like n=1 Tax=Protopterus annectens TaxID=7888 RepID=UPI001CFBFE81|nr:WD repeat-containing protein 62-like [Protopterus annectens]
MPAVRVWDVEETSQVAEIQCHKYGVSCVSFSPNMKYIVSVGYQHDMIVNVWDWKKNSIVASNKVSSKVMAASFTEDSSYFVTVGNRHVKFWYLDASKKPRVKGTVPLVGRSGILGELHNNFFCGVACGKGKTSGLTFCITNSGLLCQFNEARLLDKWIDLKVPVANCIFVTEVFIFCGCADGVVRVFEPNNLHYISNLPKPHFLGVDVADGLSPSHLFTKKVGVTYPHTIALAFDPCNSWLLCVYSDHSLYIWDVSDTKKVGKVWSTLYHSSCVWSIEMFPEVEENERYLPEGSFLTCSSDNTIRMWNVAKNSNQANMLQRNIYSSDLLKIVYVDNNVQFLEDMPGNSEKAESGSALEMKSGIRVMKISPNAKHLATGDRMGNLRIYEMQFMDEIMKVEAHDAEVLCVEYSTPEMGMNLLATASRDRLIHVLNVDSGYNLEQTLDDHSSSITAVKFAAADGQVQMISCGADKSIYFRTAHQGADGIQFTRTHHVVGKTTLYDMDIDSAHKYAAVGCQDRNIRIYNVITGKQTKCFKGTVGEDGTLLKVQTDPSGTFLATSCSDKNIAVFDFVTGECVSTMFGHSEIVTGMKFTNDCRYLITVSGDSCVFIWHLNNEISNCMRRRLEEIKLTRKQERAALETQGNQVGRESFATLSYSVMQPCDGERKVLEVGSEETEIDEQDSLETPCKDHSDIDMMNPMVLQTNGKLPLWAKRLEAGGAPFDENMMRNNNEEYQPRGRWAEYADRDLIRTILENKPLEASFTPAPSRSSVIQEDENSFYLGPKEELEPQNLEHLLEEMGDTSKSFPVDTCVLHTVSTFLNEMEVVSDHEVATPEAAERIIYPAQSDESSEVDSEYQVKELHETFTGLQPEWKNINAVEMKSEGSCSDVAFNPDKQQDDIDSLSQLSSDDGSAAEEDDASSGSMQKDPSSPQIAEQEKFLKKHFETLCDDIFQEKFDGTLTDLKPDDNNENDFFLNPRLSISTRFLCQYQKNRLANAFPPRIQQQFQGVPEEQSKIQEEANMSEYPARFSDVIMKYCKEAPPEMVPKKRELETDELKVRSSKRRTGSARMSMPVTCKARRSRYECSSETTFKLPTCLPKLNDGEKSSRRVSHQPSAQKEVSQGKISKERSYMSATASSRAKMTRSLSLVDNLNSKNLEIQQNSLDFRPGSVVTLCSSEKELSKDDPGSEDSAEQDLKENAVDQDMAGTSNNGNYEARTNLILNITKALDDKPMIPSLTPDVALAKNKYKLCAFENPKTPLLAVTPTEMKSLGKGGKSYIKDLESIQNAYVTCDMGDTEDDDKSGNQSISKSFSEGGLDQASQGASSHVSTVTDSLSDSVYGDSISDSCNVEADIPVAVPVSLRKTHDSEESPAETEDFVVNVQNCEAVANSLRETLQNALQFYSKVDSHSKSHEEQQQMKAILCDVFRSVRMELELVEREEREACLQSPIKHLKNDQTTALLERYSDMLLEIMQKKIDNK